jgi:hypothetical protein
MASPPCLLPPAWQYLFHGRSVPQPASGRLAALSSVRSLTGRGSVGWTAWSSRAKQRVTLYAPSIFPSNMVTSAGFVFPSGQTSITYNGITVTNQQGTRTYGSTDLRAQNGNIGCAQLTFGDAQGQFTTEVMPLFLYYSLTDVLTGQPLEVPSFQQGVFGVASTSGTIVMPGSVEPAGGYPACATETNSTCYVVSALKYLKYGGSVSAGFILSPAPIQSCDISTAGSCAPAPHADD